MNTLNELQKVYRQGKKLDYLFFWGHRPDPSGKIIKSCLSQWWSSPFTVDGVTYSSAEHWMMAGKAKLFNDQQRFEEIVQSKDPKKVKAIGRRITPFDDTTWVANRFDIVVQGNYHKFTQHDQLKSFLLKTGNKILVEASPVDRIWGVGLAADHQNINNPLLWKGENLLGFALMNVREMIKKGGPLNISQ